MPRVVVSPLYLTSEYVVRRPLGALVTEAERKHVPKVLYDFFTFGPEHKAGIAPIVFWDFGFNPAFGLYFFWDDAFFRNNDLRIHASTFGADWLAGSIVDRYRFGRHKHNEFSLRVRGIRRPDYLFFGLGPRSVKSHRSRYGQDTVDGGWETVFHIWRSTRVETGMGVREVKTYHGHFMHQPSIERRAATGAFPVPFGFNEKYTAEYNRLLLIFDTRRAASMPGSGVRLALEGEQASDLTHASSAWIRYGFTGGLYQDLDGHGRVLGLTVVTQFVDSLADRSIPFTELVTLGPVSFTEQITTGYYQILPGFQPGRLRDRSGAALIADYHWPIWVWLDGSLQAGVGNVFGEHLENFKPSLLRFSSALGISSGKLPDGRFEFLFGTGTETFAHGGQFNSWRVSVGVNRAF